MTASTSKSVFLLVGALALAACGGSSSDGSSGSGQRARTIRGAVTASGPGTITVNGLQVSTQGATVRTRGEVRAGATAEKGMVVTVKGSFDDRTGTAGEIELEHGIEGRVDDKGTDFVVIGGQRVNVDDTTEFGEDNPARLGSIAVGDPIAVSGVPDDNGGLRASRIDDSPRAGGSLDDDDDFDLKGFVSNLGSGSFELRLSPDATSHFVVDTSGLASVPAGLGNGAYVEVHALAPATPGTPPVLGTIAATRIEIEDRFGGSEVEVEGIVTSGTSAEFIVDGQTVRTDGATRWELGAPADLVPGVKVEAEGSLDSSGDLHAEKVSFRPGVRVTAPLVVSGSSVSILGIPVQIPSHARLDVAPVNGGWVELRANPSADGSGLVALRLSSTSEDQRPQLRGVVVAKSGDASSPTFELPFFTVTTAGASFEDASDTDRKISAAQFSAAVEAGRTVIEARARNLADVNVSGGTFAAEEVELED
jgi:hypothetical protein